MNFFSFVAILYIQSKRHYNKKHQDMEENNILDTQNKCARQMGVDEFATMLGEVRQGNMEYVQDVVYHKICNNK